LFDSFAIVATVLAWRILRILGVWLAVGRPTVREQRDLPLLMGLHGPSQGPLAETALNTRSEVELCRMTTALWSSLLIWPTSCSYMYGTLHASPCPVIANISSEYATEHITTDADGVFNSLSSSEQCRRRLTTDVSS